MATIENPFDKVQVELSALEKSNRLNKAIGHLPIGTPYFLRAKDSETGPVMQMSTYVNKDLTVQSEYFRSLDQMMNCVQKNAHVTDPTVQEKVCANEYKNLRMAALDQKLLYSEVNRRWFSRELTYKQGYSAF